jgi:hypothetical protein
MRLLKDWIASIVLLELYSGRAPRTAPTQAIVHVGSVARRLRSCKSGQASLHASGGGRRIGRLSDTSTKRVRIGVREDFVANAISQARHHTNPGPNKQVSNDVHLTHVEILVDRPSPR